MGHPGVRAQRCELSEMNEGRIPERENNSQAVGPDGGSRLAVVSHCWGIADQTKTGESE
jgi:hypothetical protein